jgi:ATP-dependent Lon protease
VGNDGQNGGRIGHAELRGHRRTYVGAMPGRIISALHRVKANNPVIMLDEIDKMSTEYQGDPSAALLEILDPNQNVHFSDHYLDAPFDLSEVFFIATANSVHHLPRPLLDRLEIIQLSGYTESEKVEIIKKHLWPTLATEHGLSPTDIKYTDQNLLEIIRGYTKEAGVRDLSRTLSKIFRKAATQKLEEVPMMKSLNAEVIEKILGAPKYKYEHSVKHEVGLVTGLAWTHNGGETLTIEASVFKGRGALTLTGHLGEVMQESAKAAFTYVRSLASELGMSEKLFRSYDVHIHVPEGAIPKDGPSAGVAIVTALASAIFNVPVRADVAMTGEVTLRGRVLPIGGVKEKLMAASRLGIKRVLLPLENKRDFKKLEPAIYQNLEVIFVESAKEVLSLALVTPLEPVKSTENEDLPPFIDSPPDELRI